MATEFRQPPLPSTNFRENNTCMCGRFMLKANEQVLARRFRLEELPPFQPRYNIAPAQPICTVRARSPRTNAREAIWLHWGLVPSWAKNPAKGPKPINARAESVTTKPTFRHAWRKRRALVPTDGFYEWDRHQKPPQPWLFEPQDASNSPLAMGALWEHWEGEDGTIIESVSVLTTSANDTMRPVHDRMPVFIPPKQWDDWLNTPENESDSLLPLLQPPPNKLLRRYPVSQRVNHATSEGEDLIKPIPEPDPLSSDSTDRDDGQLDLFS